MRSCTESRSGGIQSGLPALTRNGMSTNRLRPFRPNRPSTGTISIEVSARTVAVRPFMPTLRSFGGGLANHQHRALGVVDDVGADRTGEHAAQQPGAGVADHD